MKIKNGLVWALSFLLLINIVSFFYLNSKIKVLLVSSIDRLSQQDVPEDEKNLKESFDEAMNYRLVGNCDSFADIVSKSDGKIREEWGERCRKEKVGEVSQINDISIKRFSIRDDKAFVQADVVRSAAFGEKVSYTATYDLAKEDGKWRLLNPKDK